MFFGKNGQRARLMKPMDLRQSTRRRGVGVVCFLVLVTLSIAFLRPRRVPIATSHLEASRGSQAREAQLGTTKNSQALKTMTHYEKLHGADVMWEVPANPSAVLFLAHGCTHTALDFWEPSDTCPTCRGLPEDLALKQAALAHGYAVLGVSSQDTCWDSTFPPEESMDAQIVKSVIDDVRAREKLESLPMYALGASSGGYFVTILAHLVDFDALAVYIAGGIKAALREPLPGGKFYPPTLFVHMSRDDHTAAAVKQAVAHLRASGREAAELDCLPLPLSPGFFTERIRGLDAATSEKIFAALKAGGFLRADGYLSDDPRRSEWESVLASGVPEVAAAAEKFREHLAEELNLAYGFHELTSLKASESFDWFENRCRDGGRSVSGRCREYTSENADVGAQH